MITKKNNIIIMFDSFFPIHTDLGWWKMYITELCYTYMLKGNEF